MKIRPLRNTPVENSIKYRSVDDLVAVIKANLWRIPEDISIVVGIPRSGLLAATLIAMFRNLPVCTVQEFANGLAPQFGVTRRVKMLPAVRILLVDDSIWTGTSMANALAQLSEVAEVETILSCAIFSITPNHSGCDLVFEVLEPPRLFEWNLFHRKKTAKMGFDIDGVLCRDPNRPENDDGLKYQQFIKNSTPLITPTYPIGGVASNRLAKYEAETTQWLTDCGIDFQSAFFHPAGSAEIRLSLGDYAAVKSEAYLASNWILFIESNKEQAIEICKRTQKPVYCYANGKIYYPHSIHYQLKKIQQHSLTVIRRFTRGFLTRIAKISR